MKKFLLLVVLFFSIFTIGSVAKAAEYPYVANCTKSSVMSSLPDPNHTDVNLGYKYGDLTLVKGFTKYNQTREFDLYYRIYKASKFAYVPIYDFNLLMDGRTSEEIAFSLTVNQSYSKTLSEYFSSTIGMEIRKAIEIAVSAFVFSITSGLDTALNASVTNEFGNENTVSISSGVTLSATRMSDGESFYSPQIRARAEIYIIQLCGIAYYVDKSDIDFSRRVNPTQGREGVAYYYAINTPGVKFNAVNNDFICGIYAYRFQNNGTYVIKDTSASDSIIYV